MLLMDQRRHKVIRNIRPAEILRNRVYLRETKVKVGMLVRVKWMSTVPKVEVLRVRVKVAAGTRRAYKNEDEGVPSRGWV